MKVGIISDIHEDKEHLDQILTEMERAGVEKIACLGDIVGYDVQTYDYLSTRSASACLDMIKTNCTWVVAGNHDLFAIRKLPDLCGPFTFPANWYQLDFDERQALSQQKIWLYEQRELSALLRARDREYLDSLPLYQMANMDGLKITLTHSLYPDISGSVALRPKDPWDFSPHFQWLKSQNTTMGISGHLHLNGLAAASPKSYHIHTFGNTKPIGDLVQYICPCIAASSSRNGFLLLDTRQKTMTAVSLSPSRGWVRFFR